MIEIELFCKTVEAEIRRKHIKYLKKQKCLPDEVVELLLDDERESPDFNAINVGDKLKYVKRFNKGIETALQVLLKEYARFDKRLRAESEKGKKF
ncbi:MAG: hypothetical protein HFJ81_00630 [Clostridia bacterium]|nr:hypothetical protein [Clostridia bacterium]